MKMKAFGLRGRAYPAPAGSATAMSNLEMKEALRLCKETTTIEEIIDLTKHARPEVRKRALREMCPCRVKADVDEFWFRVLEMVEDPDNNVRQQVGMAIHV